MCCILSPARRGGGPFPTIFSAVLFQTVSSSVLTSPRIRSGLNVFAPVTTANAATTRDIYDVRISIRYNGDNNKKYCEALRRVQIDAAAAARNETRTNGENTYPVTGSRGTRRFTRPQIPHGPSRSSYRLHFTGFQRRHTTTLAFRTVVRR